MNTESAECIHGMHSACTYEDCACGCHFVEDLDEFDAELDEFDDELEGD